MTRSPENKMTVRQVELNLPDGGSLHLSCSETGTGQPVLFLHEFGCGAASWDKIIPLMNGQLRCIALDFPGSGLSDCPVETVPVPALLIELLLCIHKVSSSLHNV